MADAGAGRSDDTASDGEQKEAYRWTQTYEQWYNWQDPDDLAKKREEDEKRLNNFRDKSLCCSHDRSSERKVMEMSIQDKLEACREFRRKGNLFHQEGQYRRAALQYRQALNYYDFCFTDKDEEQQELDEMRLACLLNSAACFLACRELDDTLQCCYQVLREDPDNAKALYRRAVVYRLRDQFREASTDLGKALAQRPNDVLLRKEHAVLKSKVAAYRERSKAMGEQIFRTAGQKASTAQALPSRTSSTGSPVDGSDNDVTNHDIDEVWDPSGNLLMAVDRGRGSGIVDCSGGEGEAARLEEGRRRHDLSLPVCVELSALEDMAGCSWPANV